MILSDALNFHWQSQGMFSALQAAVNSLTSAVVCRQHSEVISEV